MTASEGLSLGSRRASFWDDPDASSALPSRPSAERQRARLSVGGTESMRMESMRRTSALSTSMLPESGGSVLGGGASPSSKQARPNFSSRREERLVRSLPLMPNQERRVAGLMRHLKKRDELEEETRVVMAMPVDRNEIVPEEYDEVLKGEFERLCSIGNRMNTEALSTKTWAKLLRDCHMISNERPVPFGKIRLSMADVIFSKVLHDCSYGERYLTYEPFCKALWLAAKEAWPACGTQAATFPMSFAEREGGATGADMAPAYDKAPKRNTAFLIPGDEELFVGGGALNGVVGRLLLEHGNQPIAFDRDPATFKYVMVRDAATGKDIPKFDKTRCSYRRLHETLFPKAAAKRETLVSAAPVELRAFPHLVFAASRVFSECEKPFGSVFLDVFKKEHRPLSDKNVALLYAVGPLGRNQKAQGEGVVDAQRGKYVKTNVQDFLEEVYKTAESSVQLVLDYNAQHASDEPRAVQPPIEVIRLPILSGGVFIHPEVTPKEVALAVLWGAHAALVRAQRDIMSGRGPASANMGRVSMSVAAFTQAGVVSRSVAAFDRCSPRKSGSSCRVDIELMPGADMQSAYDEYRRGTRPCEWIGQGRNIFQKIPALLASEPAASAGCPSGHCIDALGTTEDDGWICKGCTAIGWASEDAVCRSGITDFQQTWGMNRFRCRECNFDVCEKCFIAKSGKAAMNALLTRVAAVSRARNEIKPELACHYCRGTGKMGTDDACALCEGTGLNEGHDIMHDKDVILVMDQHRHDVIKLFDIFATRLLSNPANADLSSLAAKRQEMSLRKYNSTGDTTLSGTGCLLGGSNSAFSFSTDRSAVGGALARSALSRSVPELRVEGLAAELSGRSNRHASFVQVDDDDDPPTVNGNGIRSGRMERQDSIASSHDGGSSVCDLGMPATLDEQAFPDTPVPTPPQAALSPLRSGLPSRGPSCTGLGGPNSFGGGLTPSVTFDTNDTLRHLAMATEYDPGTLGHIIKFPMQYSFASRNTGGQMIQQGYPLGFLTQFAPCVGTANGSPTLPIKDRIKHLSMDQFFLLCKELDIMPKLLSRLQVINVFKRVQQSQEGANWSPSVSSVHSMINTEEFVEAMGVMAIEAYSMPPFCDEYPEMHVRVAVFLDTIIPRDVHLGHLNKEKWFFGRMDK